MEGRSAAEAPARAHPNDVVGAVIALAPRIREAAEAIDSERRLPDDVVTGMREAGVFRMAAPRVFGGLELDPATQVRVVEELSAADASVGWCAMIGCCSGYMSPRLEPDVAQRLLPADAVLSGQVAPRGRAVGVEGGYRVSGRWSFGSTCRHATMMMAGCLVCDGDEPRRQPDGRPETRVVLFRPSECEILDTWDTSGLRGTGSHDYATRDLFVPFDHSFALFEGGRLGTPLHRYPLLFMVNHVGVPLGLGRTALEWTIDLAGRKRMPMTGKLLREEGRVQDAIARATGALAAARGYAYTTIDELWSTLTRGGDLSPDERARYRIMMIHVHQAVKDMVLELYDVAGSSAIGRGNSLDRQLRDVLVACQHLGMQEKNYRPAGRTLLGLDPGDPTF